MEFLADLLREGVADACGRKTQIIGIVDVTVGNLHAGVLGTMTESSWNITVTRLCITLPAVADYAVLVT